MVPTTLRSLQRRDKTQIELPPEINLSLSFIETGCLVTLIDGKVTFVFKGTQTEIELLRDAKQIIFGFEYIRRPEFPSVRMYFESRDRENKPYQFDYLFGIESDEEMELLVRLKDQDSFNIILIDSEIRYSKRVNITQEGKEIIKSVMDEALG
ncbi:MAG: hypothetical protein C4291_11805 [Candidatus Dadabacteria bacterium]